MQATIADTGIEARERPFEVLSEEPNVYLLDGNIQVRVKVSVAKIGRQVDSDGNYKKNQYGDPAVLVRYGVEIVTSLVDENA